MGEEVDARRAGMRPFVIPSPLDREHAPSPPPFSRPANGHADCAPVAFGLVEEGPVDGVGLCALAAHQVHVSHVRVALVAVVLVARRALVGLARLRRSDRQGARAGRGPSGTKKAGRRRQAGSEGNGSRREGGRKRR